MVTIYKALQDSRRMEGRSGVRLAIQLTINPLLNRLTLRSCCRIAQDFDVTHCVSERSFESVGEQGEIRVQGVHRTAWLAQTCFKWRLPRGRPKRARRRVTSSPQEAPYDETPRANRPSNSYAFLALFTE